MKRARPDRPDATRRAAIVLGAVIGLGWPHARTASADCPEWEASPPPDAFQIAWHPYSERLVARVGAGVLARATKMPLIVRVRTAEGNARVAERPIDPSSTPPEVEIPLPDLPAGAYAAELALPATPGCTRDPGPTASFHHARFGWEHNTLGITDDVIPPFTPLEVDGRTVRSVLRSHALDETGLWSQVESLGRPLLASPVRLEIVVDGRARPARPEQTLTIEQVGPGRVVARGGFTAGGLHGRLVTTFEMDGLARVRLELDGDPDLRVDRLDLVVPIRAEHASLLNAIGDRARRHTLGPVPDGDGTVWSSARAAGLELPRGFVPYVWIGDETRGLSWLAESTRDWWIEPGAPVQTLTREGSVVELRVRLVTAPGPLGRRRSLGFALQATPVKPRPADWRRWFLSCVAPPSMKAVCPLSAGWYWGTASPYGDVYPRSHDERILGMLAAARAGSPPSREAIEAWLDEEPLEEEIRSRVLDSLLFSVHALSARPDAVVAYVNAHVAAWTPEFAVYVDEWRGTPFGEREGRFDDPEHVPIVPVRSFQDFVLWYLDRLLASGAVDGFFFDNTYLRAWFDTRLGTAWRSDDGRVVRPGVDLMALRELLMRAQVLVWQRRGQWLDVAHMTSTPIAAVHGWAGINLDGEWHYGATDFQQRFPRTLMRAASLGQSLGTVPVYLPGIEGEQGARQRLHLERSLAGVTALHEIRVLARSEGPLESVWETLLAAGYGSADCRVRPYWESPRAAWLRDGDGEALLIVCDESALALVVSYGARGPVALELAPDVIGGAPIRCRDAESGGRLEALADAPGCRLSIRRNEFRLVRIEREEG